MPVDERDLERWAARVRPYFEPPLQDVAEGAAAVLVMGVGSRIKQLRPETPMADVVSWLKDARKKGSASLDWVEMLMAVEEEVSSEVSDDFAETLEERTFREYVKHLQANRRGV